MTSTAETAETRGRGRRTKEEEARAYLEEVGLDPDKVLGSADPNLVKVPDADQIVDEIQAELYRQMKAGQLTGTALVNGLKAVQALAEARKEPDEEAAEDVREIDEVLVDAGLPVARRLEIGRQELARLDARSAALTRVVKEIEVIA